MTKIIALDVDQVLVDYTKAYAKMWKSAFGVNLELKHPQMFHSFNAYECPFEKEEQKQFFYNHCYAEELWDDMPLLEGAAEGCEKLVSLGFELVCVTSMKPFLLDARKRNLKNLGLPISETYAVGRDRDRPAYNPKKEILMDLKPVVFVDDYAINFEGLCGIHRALLHRNQPDSPNYSLMHLVDTTHDYLNDFAEFWSHKISKKSYHWITKETTEWIYGNNLHEDGVITHYLQLKKMKNIYSTTPNNELGPILAKLMLNDLSALMKAETWSWEELRECREDIIIALRDLASCLYREYLTHRQVREVLEYVWNNPWHDHVEKIIEIKNNEVSNDVYEPIMKLVLNEQPQSVADYKAGKTKALGFLTGQVMKKMSKGADPKIINEMLKEMLNC